MNKEELFSKIMSLAPTSYEHLDYRVHLSNVLKQYLSLIRELNVEDMPEQWDVVIKECEGLIAAIKEAVKRVYMGQHSSAYNILRKRLYGLPQFHLYAGFRVNSEFFRMRVFDSNVEDDPCSKEMFHIPFDKRGIVKTERYSTPGYPCLYLGLSSYVCWEEMNRPNLDKCYVSRLHSRKEITTLNMSLPLHEEWNTNEDSFIGSIVRFPLIISSMICVKNRSDFFKPEYIIPQLIMEWIIELQRKKEMQEKPIGVFYTSIHINHGFNYPDYVYNNLAIPAQSPFSGRYSKELCDIFEISEPTSDELERAKGTQNRADNIYLPPKNPTDEDIKIHDYKVSAFGTIERALFQRENEYPLRSLNYAE